MNAITLPDIAGDNALHQLTTNALIKAKGLIFSLATGSGSVRVGDANTSASRGVAVPTSAPLVMPTPSDNNDLYLLSTIYAYVPSGTTVSITYVV